MSQISKNIQEKIFAPAWKPLASAYHAHHFACPTCIAAGQGYGTRCADGLNLWKAYSAV